eukprot:9469286-Prorocentrum_lima.AAC.1
MVSKTDGLNQAEAADSTRSWQGCKMAWRVPQNRPALLTVAAEPLPRVEDVPLAGLHQPPAHLHSR